MTPRRGPSARLLREVAASVDAPPALISCLPELLADLSSLGSAPRRIVNLIARHGLAREARVIELACGKGALAVMLAEKLGARVEAFDAFAPFLEEGRALADRKGVSERVRFVRADVSRVRPRVRADLALMIGLFPLERAASALRRLVRPGGLYVVDDALRIPAPDPRGEFEHLHSARSARALIESLGDEALGVVVLPARDVARQNRAILRALSRRAASLGRERPALVRPLREFLRRQRQSSRALEGPIRPAIIVARRGAGPGERRA